MDRRGVPFLLSAAAAEVLHQATDAHDGHDDEEDDDEDPGMGATSITLSPQAAPAPPPFLLGLHPAPGQEARSVLCGPSPPGGCALRSWPWAHLKGPEKNSYSWQQPSPQHLNPAGQQLSPQHLNPSGQLVLVGREDVVTEVGRQKDASLLKTRPALGV